MSMKSTGGRRSGRIRFSPPSLLRSQNWSRQGSEGPSRDSEVRWVFLLQYLQSLRVLDRCEQRCKRNNFCWYKMDYLFVVTPQFLCHSLYGMTHWNYVLAAFPSRNVHYTFGGYIYRRH